MVPADMLQAFAPWTQPTSVRPANGLLGDQVQQLYPWRVLAHQELARGAFPLWNPHGGGGAPLFANGQSALLFPLNVAVLWLPPDLAATVVQLFKPPLAAIGTALFLRALGVGTAGCILAGIAWAFSGPMVTWLGWPHTNALLMIPYLFWTTTRWLQSGLWPWWIGLAAAVAVQLFGGHPETTAHGLVALGLFVGVWILGDLVGVLRGKTPLPNAPPQGGTEELVTSQGRGEVPALPNYPQQGGKEQGARALLVRQFAAPLLKGVGWLGAVAAGVALAAVQVVPLLAAISESVTAAERSGRGLAALVLDRETLLTWLVPNFFGTPLAQTIGPLNYLNYNETMGYVGLGTVVLAFVSVIRPTRPGWAGLALLTVVALGLTYGLPVLTELRRFPGLDYAANTRFVFIVAFGVACLAGLGLDAVLSHPRRWPALAAVGACAVIAAVGAAFALAPDLLAPSAAEAAPLTPLDAVWLRQRELAKTAAIALATTLALAAIAIGWNRAARWSQWIAALALVAVATDLVLFGRSYNPTPPADLLRQVPEAVAFIQGEDPSGRVIGLGEALLPNTSILVGLNDLRVYEPVGDRRLFGFFEHVDPLLRTDIRSRFYLFVWNPNVELLRLAGVRWVLVPLADRRVVPESELAAAGLVRRYADPITAVWEVPGARPRAYFIDRWSEAADEAAMLATLESSSASQGTVVEGSAPHPPGPAGAGGGVGTATVAPRFEPGRIVLDVSTDRPGLVVVNEALYAGWTAWLDGSETPILHANGLFMAVPVADGDHSVTLEYRPRSLVLGMAVTAAAVGVLLLAMVFVRIRR